MNDTYEHGFCFGLIAGSGLWVAVILFFTSCAPCDEYKEYGNSTEWTVNCTINKE
jgi:hypothetical protein